LLQTVLQPLHVSDTVIANSGTATVRGTGSGHVTVTFTRVSAEHNAVAFKGDTSGKPSGFTSLIIRDSMAATSTLYGIWTVGETKESMPSSVIRWSVAALKTDFGPKEPVRASTTATP
jgi:hypothetical protein